MTSPFPGMDPYLEASWGDVHARLILFASIQLQTRLPGDLRARVEERIVVETPEAERDIVPDVRVIERGRADAGGGVAVADEVATAEPLVITVPNEPETQGFIEIRDIRSGRRVVSVVEVLSPSNKRPGAGRDKYEEKQSELKRAGVNLIEIDLLRAGRRTLAVPAEWVPAAHRTAYAACVRRGHRPGAYEYYRAPLRERLPAIRVPLRPGDADVPLDLQALVDQCYRTGAYADDLDYRVDPDPPLDPDDAAWAAALLLEKGLR